MNTCPDCGERVYALGCTHCNDAAYREDAEMRHEQNLDAEIARLTTERDALKAVLHAREIEDRAWGTLAQFVLELGPAGVCGRDMVDVVIARCRTSAARADHAEATLREVLIWVEGDLLHHGEGPYGGYRRRVEVIRAALPDRSPQEKA